MVFILSRPAISGISTTILSVIILTADKYKRELIVLSIIYLLILSFVVFYGGVHYPIDVIGEGIIGIISALIVVHVLENYFKDKLVTYTL
ncbi:MAG: hypothetical protein U0L35_07365 [Methanobrevibacter sp.]|nr:hypothetical protein [Methanobrevibacter sp.]